MKLHLGDCLEVMKTMEDNSVDSIVTDPPYGLSAARNSGKTSKGGFMGKEWDYDVPSVEIWREALRVLKPGGHLLAFSGTRTYHRMVVNIEDAGFEIRDCIQWLYGSGFPKSLNVSKAIDKAKPATPEAKRWEGWGTQLKPANEPICLARKPLVGTVIENVLKHGTGAMNIDECRITTGLDHVQNTNRKSVKDDWGNSEGAKSEAHENGRFPANVILECICDEVIETEIKGGGHWANAKVTGYGDGIGNGTVEYRGVGPKEDKKATSHTNPNCPCRILDEQAPSDGNMMNANRKTTTTGGTGNAWTTSSKNEGDSNGIFDGLGGGSRFFYCPKVSQAERNAGLEPLEDKEKYADFGLKNRIQDGVITNDRTNNAAYTSKNNHPTVKPLSLMAYLCRLVTPPHGTVLDPFMGSGSTGIAACMENFDFIGIDMEEEYVEIARHRIAHWSDYILDDLEVGKETDFKPVRFRNQPATYW